MKFKSKCNIFVEGTVFCKMSANLSQPQFVGRRPVSAETLCNGGGYRRLMFFVFYIVQLPHLLIRFGQCLIDNWSSVKKCCSKCIDKGVHSAFVLTH